MQLRHLLFVILCNFSFFTFAHATPLQGVACSKTDPSGKTRAYYLVRNSDERSFSVVDRNSIQEPAVTLLSTTQECFVSRQDPRILTCSSQNSDPLNNYSERLIAQRLTRSFVVVNGSAAGEVDLETFELLFSKPDRLHPGTMVETRWAFRGPHCKVLDATARMETIAELEAQGIRLP